jgi:asparagine synthase (glutamine-hydrolysing)
LYDVLRADRCIASHSLEARVPFSDKDFVSYVMAIDPTKKMNSYGHGKYLLRKAFEEGDYLPVSILYREKAAFSDAVGHSMVDFIKEYAEEVISDSEFRDGIEKYNYAKPFTKESLLFRNIFEEFYPGKSHLISEFWMPNREWDNCDVLDPSARALPNYGTSGM